MNVPFVPVRGLLGTDYMRVRPDFKAVANPYDEREEIALVPAVAPDVAVFHGWKRDRHGNVDLEDLRAKAAAHRDRLAALMITYPSTHGVFEPKVRELCQVPDRELQESVHPVVNISAFRRWRRFLSSE